MSAKKNRSIWVQPWSWRWRGKERWHRLAVGPLAISLYPGSTRERWFVSHSWQYRHPDGEMRHVPSFRRWLRSVRRSA